MILKNTVVDRLTEVSEEDIAALVEKISQPSFLFGLAFQLAAQTLLELVARGDTEHLTMVNGAPFLKPEITQYVHQSLQMDIIARPLYWREIAKNLLIDKEQLGKRDKELTTNFILPILHQLLSDTNFYALPSYTLCQLLGLRLEQELEALRKLSKMQKYILAKLFKQVMDLPTKMVAIPWLPDEFFPNVTSTERVSISKSLKRLSERNLIKRFNINQSPISGEGQPSQRTAFVQLTELGLLVGKQICLPTIPFST